MTPAQLRALRFVDEHPGGYRRRAMFSWRYVFNAPEFKRSPVRLATLKALIDGGYLTTRSSGGLGENIYVSASGRAALNAARAVDQRR